MADGTIQSKVYETVFENELSIKQGIAYVLLVFLSGLLIGTITDSIFLGIMGVIGISFIIYILQKDRDILILVAAVGLFVIVFISQYTDQLTPEFVTAFATVVLAVVTMGYVSLTAELVEQQSTEQRRPLMRSLSYDVIIPSIETIRDNKIALEVGELIGWHQIPHPKNQESGQSGYTSLEVIVSRTDRKPGIMSQFQEQFPELCDKMMEHDLRLQEMDNKAKEIIYELGFRGVGPYIRDNDLPVKDKPYIIIEAVLAGPNPLSKQHNYHTTWQNHREEFQEIAEEAAGESLKEFYKLQQEYFDISEELIEELIEKRNEIQKNIGIE